MMHEPEKSDSVVVAAKPTNKAEQSDAEPVEPRTGTEGNAGQQSTRRAQNRGSVTQALERVRQGALPRRQTPEVRAGCGNSARPDLGGGRSAMSFPTANAKTRRGYRHQLISSEIWPILIDFSRANRRNSP